MNGRAGTTAAGVGLLLLAAVAAAPGAPPRPAAGASPPDTVTAILAGPTGAPAPAAVLTWPDTVTFGDPVWVALRGAAGARTVVTHAPGGGEEWLGWESIGDLERATRDGVGVKPPRGWPTAGAQVVGRARFYRSGPARLGWAGPGGPASPVILVRPRVSADASPAPVRDPRGLGWRRGRLALLAAIAAAAAIAAWRLRRRQRAPASAVDAPLPPPAYLAAARVLWELHREGLPERGEGRRFLDRLSHGVRDYLRDRYRIPAEALTPDEVARALSGLAHPPRLAAAGERLLRACDERRYAPDAAGARACSALMAEATMLLEAGLVPARFTPVPAALAVEGEAAWSRLREALAGAPGGAWRGEEGRGA